MFPTFTRKFMSQRVKEAKKKYVNIERPSFNVSMEATLLLERWELRVKYINFCSYSFNRIHHYSIHVYEYNSFHHTIKTYERKNNLASTPYLPHSLCPSNLMATIFNHSFSKSCKNERKSPPIWRRLAIKHHIEVSSPSTLNYRSYKKNLYLLWWAFFFCWFV